MSSVGPRDGPVFANGGVTLRNVWGLGWKRERVGLCNCYCLLRFMIQPGSGRLVGDGLGSVSLGEAWVPSCPGLLLWEVMCSWGSTLFTCSPYSSVALSALEHQPTPHNLIDTVRTACSLKGLHLLRCGMGKAWFKFKISSRLSGNSR